MYGDNKFRAIELKYGNGSKSDSFFMFSVYWCDEDGPQQILGFVLQSLIKLLKYKKLFLHVNVTFGGAPRGFHHVVIFSVTHTDFLLSHDQEVRGSLQPLMGSYSFNCG